MSSPPAPGSIHSSDDQRPYLATNAAFYDTFWTTTRFYTSRFPNGDEASRAAVILEYLSGLAEVHDWEAHPPRLLDAGCGRGWLTNLLSVYGPAEGCEPVVGAISAARALFPHLTFHVATPGELARRPGAVPFDVVVSSEVLEHVPAPLQAGFVAELADCVKPGGFVVLTTRRGELQPVAGESSAQLMENWLTEAQVRALLTGAGLTPIGLRRALPTHAFWLDRLLRRWRRLWGQTRIDRSATEVSLDHRSSLYQIWGARRG